MIKVCCSIITVTVMGLSLTPQALMAQRNCDRSYPDVCIPAPPPDLDCGDISHRNFRVVGVDPHRFDGDDDGIGCEA